jgi:cobalt-zinc-cadmium efflux system protein
MQIFKTSTPEKALKYSFLLTFAFLLLELYMAWYSKSLGLLSDALHMLTDVFALGVSLLAIKIAKIPADANHSFGHQRIEILTSFLNSFLLFLIALFMIYHGVERFFNPVMIKPNILAITAFAGLLVNLICLLLLKAHVTNIAVRSAYNEALADFMSSVGLLIASLVILFFNFQWVDSVIAIAIGLWALPRSYTLLKECVHILMEGVPYDIETQKIADTLLAIDGIYNVHDIHIWTLTQNQISLTAHLVHQAGINTDELLQKAHLAALGVGIHHTTFQCELSPCSHSDHLSYHKENA